MSRKQLGLWVVALAMLGGAGYSYMARRADSAPKSAAAAPAVPVVAATAKTADVPLLLEAVGRGEAYETVTIKSRVDGQVLSVPFREGQHVQQGDLLVQLDPADFRARLAQAEAAVARDQAQLAKARSDVARYASLKDRGFVSEEKVTEVRTTAAAMEATLDADRASADLARLQLGYATIRAPFAGVIGAKLVFPGAVVKTNDTALAVINRVRPLYVSFAVSEKHLPRLRAAMRQGALRVAVAVPGDAAHRYEGEARFIDNAVDTTTGTIQMKAVVRNDEERLTPGQFVNVSMVLEQLRDAVVVPAQAIQQGPEGSFVFVIRDNTADMRKVGVVAVQQGQAVIAQGVQSGETVVTDGQLRLTPGAKVQLRSAEPARG